MKVTFIVVSRAPVCSWMSLRVGKGRSHVLLVFSLGPLGMVKGHSRQWLRGADGLGEAPAFESSSRSSLTPTYPKFSGTPRTLTNVVSFSLQVAVGPVNRKQSGPKPDCTGLAQRWACL